MVDLDIDQICCKCSTNSIAMRLKRIEKAFACTYILDHLVAETIRFKRLFLRKFVLNVRIRAYVQHLDANSVSRLTSELFSQFVSEIDYLV